MALRNVVAACAALALVVGCHAHHVLPPNTTTLPRFGAPGAHAIYTIYAFHNDAGDDGLPVSPSNDGAAPKGSLTLVSVGGTNVLFGRTAAGGNASACGVWFKLAPSGSNYALVYSFSGNDGCSPRHDAMVQDAANGLLYSTTQGENDAATTTYNGGQILTLDPSSLDVTNIHAFAGPTADGAQQHSSFSIDPSSGVLYGQTALGGANSEGFLYSIAPAGGATTDLYDFSDAGGDEPHGRIIQVGSTLWGITRKGGAGGYGTVFSYALPAGPFTDVHDFTGSGSDGSHADHGYLTVVNSGGQTLLYGMTQCGGTGGGGDASNCSGYGNGDGVIFQINPATGAYNTYYQFTGTNNSDGADPYGSLLYDASGGFLYGMTRNGGSQDKGTIFRIFPGPFGTTGTVQQVYHFDGADGDGAYPIDNVIMSGGTLYGMTTEGGSSKDDGTIFAIAP